MCGMMEVYKCVRSDKKIEIIVPLENQEQFRLLCGGGNNNGKEDGNERNW